MTQANAYLRAHAERQARRRRLTQLRLWAFVNGVIWAWVAVLVLR